MQFHRQQHCRPNPDGRINDFFLDHRSLGLNWALFFKPNFLSFICSPKYKIRSPVRGGNVDDNQGKRGEAEEGTGTGSDNWRSVCKAVDMDRMNKGMNNGQRQSSFDLCGCGFGLGRRSRGSVSRGLSRGSFSMLVIGCVKVKGGAHSINSASVGRMTKSANVLTLVKI